MFCHHEPFAPTSRPTSFPSHGVSARRGGVTGVKPQETPLESTTATSTAASLMGAGRPSPLEGALEPVEPTATGVGVPEGSGVPLRAGLVLHVERSSAGRSRRRGPRGTARSPSPGCIWPRSASLSGRRRPHCRCDRESTGARQRRGRRSGPGEETLARSSRRQSRARTRVIAREWCTPLLVQAEAGSSKVPLPVCGFFARTSQSR